jgi:hypothetical protein
MICNRQTGINSPRYIQRETRFCNCGCGKSYNCMVTSTKKYINGHNSSRKGQKQSLSAINKQRKAIMIPILQFDKNDNFIKEWESCSIAANVLNLNKTSINSCLKQRTKSSGNFKWKYKN